MQLCCPFSTVDQEYPLMEVGLALPKGEIFELEHLVPYPARSRRCLLLNLFLLILSAVRVSFVSTFFFFIDPFLVCRPLSSLSPLSAQIILHNV
ncbi:hypothetical protein HETIRDRAFT_145360 [Heterobasidion irregulare TC 32-1]|uniref:Uncharacterized protein n=1 Tax=Heterobasidion irregulare (strain TC 32-1) TaxID=747525 RepID=W4KMX8_HETIT|nr:uncharacterized protein HETIRDRAFT_145360 [Heterobasidion irregulare TC 32-1]ETW87198.1 hypothetical protein HETIRDRAFT_145360 [Heterobasidion irregulare TC 32-1]